MKTIGEMFKKSEYSKEQFTNRFEEYLRNQQAINIFTSYMVKDYLLDFMNSSCIITEEERVILRNIKGYTTIIRNIEGNIQVQNNDGSFACLCAFNNLFQFIKERRRI